MMRVNHIMEQAHRLTLTEYQELLQRLQAELPHHAEEEPHSILELAGLGADIWQGIDVEAYLKQLRDEWDDR